MTEHPGSPARAVLALLFVMVSGSMSAGQPSAERVVNVEWQRDGALVLSEPLWDATMTALATDAGLVVIDTFMLRTSTEAALRTARERLAGGDVAMLINTHGHDDHAWGNQVVQAREHVGHERIVGYMEARRDQLAGFLERAPARLAELRAELDALLENSADREVLAERVVGIETNLRRHADVIVTPPADGLLRDTTRTVGGLELRLLAVGPAHSTGDLVVVVPDRKLMVVGDLARRDAITGLGDDGSITRWVVALERLESIAEDLGVDTVIAGHGPPGGRDVLREARAYWSELAREVEEAIAEDISAEQIAERVPMERFRGLEHYDLHHRRNVEEAFAQLTSSSNVGAVGETAPNVVAAP